MPKKAKRGRPRLPKGAAKESRLICRIQKSEEKEIELAARNAKMSKSDWMRETLLQAARA
jgi:hypothetical protein